MQTGTFRRDQFVGDRRLVTHGKLTRSTKTSRSHSQFLEFNCESDSNRFSANASFEVQNHFPVSFSGITIRAQRDDWIAMDLPPLESRQASLDQLNDAQRQRIESEDFYLYLAENLKIRFREKLKAIE